jgi:hypothetical protein
MDPCIVFAICGTIAFIATVIAEVIIKLKGKR